MALLKKRKSNLPEDETVGDENELEKGKPAPGELTVGLLKRRHNEAVLAISKERREYRMNRLFLSGHQWIKWNDHSHAYVPWSRRGGRYQATDNKLDSYVNTIVSKLMKADLVFEVPANSADDYALDGALVSESILRQKRVDCGWEPKREELYVATITGGTAALAVDWDTTRKSYGSVYVGDTKETVLPITQFALQPSAPYAREALYWFKEQVLPPEDVQGMYNLAELPKADFQVGESANFAGVGSGTNKGVLVLTYYERPNPLRPQGAVAVIVGNSFAWGPKPWPFPFKHLNLDVSRATVVPGKWTGETPLSKARSLQVQYNFVLSNIQEHIRKISTAKLAAPYGSSEALEQWDDDPANPVRYPDGATPPHYITAPSMPNYVIQQLDRLDNDMQDIMGVHAISMGESPANLESGYGISLLAEQDATPAGRLAKDCARVWENGASMVLELCASKVKDTRQATVYEPKNDIAHVVSWTGKDLAGQTRAIIPPDSVIGRNKAQMQMWAENLAKMGFIQPDNEGLTLMMELAEIPGREDALWYINPAEARARREVYRMLQGEVVVPRDFHDHKIAIKVANRFRNSPRYEALPDKMKLVVDKYCDAHETMDAEEAGQSVSEAGLSPMLAQSASANERTPVPPEMMGLPPAPPAGTLPQGTPEEAVMAPTQGAIQ